MLERNTLVSLQDTQTGLKYGKSLLQFVENTKALRKAQGKLSAMQDQGILRTDIIINPTGILHTLNGDVYPAITDAYGNTSYVKPDIVQSIGSTHTDIAVVTGTCLMGESNAIGLTNTGTAISLVNRQQLALLGEGEMITEILTAPNIHPYEMDTIARISQSSSLIAKGDGTRSNYIHVPTVEYWLYLLDTYNQGHITQEALLQWCTHVQQHGTAVGDSFTKRTVKYGQNDVSVVNPFNPIQEDIYHGVATGGQPTLADMVQSLYEIDEHWRFVLDQETPTTYTDLANLGNVVTYISALARHQGLVCIENPEENKILKKTNALWHGSDESFIGGLFVHPHIFVADGDSIYGDIHDLYYLKPHSPLSVAKQIMRANTHL